MTPTKGQHGFLTVAEGHAYGLWMKIEQHTVAKQCGCRIIEESDSLVSFRACEHCELGSLLLDEYNIAARRVRELRGETLEAGAA